MKSTTQTGFAITAVALSLITANLATAALKESLASPKTTAATATRSIVAKLEFKNATPAEVLQAISTASGITIIYTITPTERADLTLSLRDIPASEAFTMVSALSGRKFRYEANGVRFMPSPVLYPEPR